MEAGYRGISCSASYSSCPYSAQQMMAVVRAISGQLQEEEGEEMEEGEIVVVKEEEEVMVIVKKKEEEEEMEEQEEKGVEGKENTTFNLTVSSRSTIEG